MAGERKNIYRAAFAHRDFRWLMAAFVQSRAGDFLYTVALIAVVFDRTHSAGWVAATAVFTRLPLVILPPITGALADRYERRNLLILLDVGCALMMAGLTVATVAGAHAAVLIALATLMSVLATPYNAASAALEPDLIPEGDLAATNAVSGGLEALAFIIGPAVGGLLLVLSSPSVAFAVNALTFVGSAACMLKVRQGHQPEREPGEAGPGVLGGFRSLASDPGVLALAVGVCAVCLTLGSTNVTFILISEERLGTGTHGLGYLLAAVGAGGFLGSLLTTRMAAARRMSVVVVVNLVVVGGAIALMAAVTAPAVAYVLALGFGAAYLLLEILAVTLMQRCLPGDRLGQATGALDASAFGCLLLGALAAPALVNAIGLRAAIVVLAAPPVAAAAITLALSMRLDRESAARLSVLQPRLDLLARVDALAGASQAALERLAAAMVEEQVAAGTVVVREGAPADDFFVVVDGTFDVASTGGRAHRPTHVRNLQSGDYFGEIGLMQNRPRTATVSATEDSVVYRAPGEEFMEVVTESPTLVGSFGDVASSRLARTHASA